MKIAEIRSTIRRLNMTRNDLAGATRDEFKKMDVRIRLTPQIEACEALEIPPRFTIDITDCNNAVDRAKGMILRWLEMNRPAATEIIRGWWKLEIIGVDELSDSDSQRIGKLISEGFTSGNIIQEERP